MRARDITAVAVDDAGRVYVAAGGAEVAVVEGGRVAAWAEAPPGAAIVSLAPRPRGGVVAADALANCVRAATPDGRWEVAAGAPQPPALDARPRRADGPTAGALFRSPRLVAAAPGLLFCVEMGSLAIRVVDDGIVRTLEIPASPMREITAASAAPDGALYVADGATPVPCVYRLEPDGRLTRVAGDPDRPGIDDGSDARFARVASLAAVAGGCFVADGSRVRFVSGDGLVRTVAGGGPGFRDGPAEAARFGAIGAVALAPDGALVVADPDNGALRRVDDAGAVSTLARDVSARAFGDALVDGDVAGASAIAESLLADHARRGVRRPERDLHPVSVASARVGRRLALEWCAPDDATRARLGAYCLWLIRSEEGLGAPPEDAAQLVGAVATALGAGDLAGARRAVEVVRIAFGGLARRRDRLAVAEAYRRAGATRFASDLFAARDPAARELAAEVVEQARDVRFTPALAARALEGDRAAARALRAIWESPAYTAEQAAELRAGLRFGRAILDRLFAERGDAALGRRGAARYRRVIAGGV